MGNNLPTRKGSDLILVWAICVTALLSLLGCLETSSTPLPVQTYTPTSAPPTITPTETPVPTETPTPSTVTYVVQAGDTLGMIAFNFGVSMESVMRANDLDDPSLIWVGQELVIPLGGEEPVEPPSEEEGLPPNLLTPQAAETPNPEPES
jgi:LysM repeat protein